MRVLVVGSGAREHALAWRLSRDSEVDEVFVAPGNAGSRAIATPVDLPLPTDEASIESFVRGTKALSVDLVVVGPEAPLVSGAVDALMAEGVLAFGPSRAAARLEGSKAFSKEFMGRYGIPTASFRVFDDPLEAKRYAKEHPQPLVVKADGLAAGKGVTVAADADEAVHAIEAMMEDRAFGDAGQRVVLEERLLGQEVSFHVVCDGTRYVALAPAQDHKRALDGDQGPNTGGMGAYSPPPVVTAEVQARICREVIEPTLQGMRDEGCPFRGVLFVGLMIDRGEPRVLEYNVRFGDPECECLMVRLGGSFVSLLAAAAKGDLTGYEPKWEAPCAMTVVLASQGYPGAYRRGVAIGGLQEASAHDHVSVFHAGTALDGDRFVTAGGRVLAVTASGDTVEEAASRAYAAVEKVRFEGCHFRRDIGHHAR